MENGGAERETAVHESLGENGSQPVPEDAKSSLSIGADEVVAMREGSEVKVQKDADDLVKGSEGFGDSGGTPKAQEQKMGSASEEPAKDSGLVDVSSDSLQDREAIASKSKSTQRRSQSASHDPINNHTVPAPFHFSTDGRVRRSSDGALQLNPESAKKKLRSSSLTAPAPAEESKATPPVRKTMPKPFNLEGMKRHEKAVEQLKAEVAAKEAEENAPRSFRARPILKPDAVPATRVVPPPTKPSAFKLSVEDRAERRDKFKKKVEDRERQEETEREKMLHELKEELDKEEKQVRRKTSFKAAPARITPDNKVFKPKLGQTPKTEPQAPALGAQRRHSTGTKEGDSNNPASSPKPASPAPGATPATPRLSRPPPNRNTTKVSSPRVSKPASAIAAKTPVKTPVKTPAKSPAKTPSPKSDPVGSPLPKPAAPAVRGVSPRLYKPVAPKSPSPGPGKVPVTGSGKAPSPLQKKPTGSSSPASPRPPSARPKEPIKRRSSEGSESAKKPSGVATGTPSPSRIARSPVASTAKQAPRPVSAKGAGTKSPGGASPRVGARPGSASGGQPGPGEKKPTPRKTVPAKGPGKSPKIEEKETDSGPTKETVDKNGAVEKAGTEHVDGGDVTASIEKPSSEPLAELELSAKQNGVLGEEEKASEEEVPLATALASGEKHDTITANDDTMNDGHLTKKENNGVAHGGSDEALLDTVLVQFDKVLTTES